MKDRVIRSGSPDSSMDRVADFYGAYIDARLDRMDDLAERLRAYYLTEGLQRRLAEWEEANRADGVLRTPDSPIDWEVRYHETGVGLLFTVITLTWENGDDVGHTRLAVQSDVGSKLISDIRDAE
ncbi:hypothetical protein GNZ18_29350 [Actinomadura sp. NEAU-AAG5]|uniref:Uncharacterized protein n=1 Tax=Actinomadura litoris TaxID=2678616 RepID=A0A7K1L8C6_9ACTN|nr:hypothetical protein [Actinomadura litoris]